jgi:enamine deaminase RidA (YjgF/YER057c/UK114 family)
MTRAHPGTPIDRLHFINPPGLCNPGSLPYSHLAVFPASWRWVLPSGQGGETKDGALSTDFATQFRQALANVETALAAGGATLSDVAKVTYLIVDHNPEKFRVMTEEVERIWGSRKPASTLIPFRYWPSRGCRWRSMLSPSFQADPPLKTSRARQRELSELCLARQGTEKENVAPGPSFKVAQMRPRWFSMM